VIPIKGKDDRCIVDYELRYQFTNPLYRAASKSFGGSVANKMIEAFTARAEELHSEGGQRKQ
jgi:ribosome-associated toxin RatA of RatAB toxin-antitoxin module